MGRERRWFVLLAAVFVSTFEFGVLFSLSALYIPIIDTFQTDRATAALVQSISLGVAMCMGMITGFLIKVVGCGKTSAFGAILTPLGYIVSYFAESVLFLIISLGVVSGIGISFMYVSSTVVVAEYFEEPLKSLALAIVQSGVGVAGVFYPYLMTFLLDMYGLQSTYLIIGGIFLNSLAASLLYRKVISVQTRIVKPALVSQHDMNAYDNPAAVMESLEKDDLLSSRNSLQDETTPLITAHHDHLNNDSMFYDDQIRTDGTQHSSKLSETLKRTVESFKQLIRDYTYMLFLLGDSLIVSFANGFVAVIVDVFSSAGYSSDEGLSAFLPYFIASIAGRLLPGIIQQNQRMNPLIVPLICGVIGVSGQLAILLSSEFAIMMLGCGLSGLSVGGAISSSSVVATRLVEKEAFPVAFGLITTVSGALSAISAPLNGFIRDQVGSYNTALILTASVQLLGTLLLLVVVLRNKKSFY